MKKLVSIFVALIMILTLCIPVFAEDANNTEAVKTTIKVENANGRTYVGYQLMTLTTSLKTGEHHPDDCDNVNHDPDCYNYAYKINPKYSTILKTEAHDNAGTDFWGVMGKPAVGDVTDDQVMQYLSKLSSDLDDGTYGTLRRAADRIYRAIIAANLGADTDPAATTEFANVGQGYWMIADVTTETNAANDVYSLVMLNTAGEKELVLAPKTDLPTISKKVQDINDTEDQHVEDNAWEDSADHDINDVVPFKLTATLPSNVRAYSLLNTQTYSLTFHDELDKAFVLNEDSIKVYMYQYDYKANLDVEFKNPQYVIADGKFNKNITTDAEGNTKIEIGFDNVFAINGIAATEITPDTVFVVHYTATLNGTDADGNSLVKVGAAGNVNEAYLEYSNNPYTDGKAFTEPVKATVYTYGLIINKVDIHEHALKGAGFTLSKFDSTTGQFKVVSEIYDPESTQFVWNGLDDGEYKLEEHVVPSGYNAMAPIVFDITANHTVDSMTNLSAEDTIGADDDGNGIIEQKIVNKTGTVLPSTGAAGTMWLIFGGAMLIGFAAVFMITRKKMSVYED